jgi:tripartite-type tricarboxylate transporter receptor subunit TctC
VTAETEKGNRMNYAIQKNSRRSLLMAAALMCSVLPLSVGAQNWPDKPIKIVVPAPGGSAVEVMARLLSDKLQARTGQAVVVDTRPGADGGIAAVAVKSATDGHTFLLGNAGIMTINPHFNARLPYDPVKDFVPVGLISTAPVGLVVGKDHKANTIQEFIAMAKAAPGKHSYASSGGVLELVVEALKQKAGIDLLGVTYKGPTEGAIDVMSGRVDLLSASLSSVAPNVQAGRMKALAVMSPQRWSGMPNVPSMIEAGYKDFQVVGWNGLFAPAGTPAPIVNRLNAELNKLLLLPDVKKQFDTLGFEVVHLTPAQFTAFLADDIARFEGISKAAGIVKK